MRWLPLIAVIALAVLTGCGGLQQDADDEAARVADHVLPEALGVAISDADTPEERGVAAEDWLSEPGRALSGSRVGAAWAVRGSQDTTIRVDVYQYLESGSFLPPDQGDAGWGVACRTYDVAEAVATSTVECPPGTPEEP